MSEFSRNIDQEIADLLKTTPYEVIEIRNDSPSHAGHGYGGQNSHYTLRIRKNFHSATERMQAHQSVYRALAPLYPSEIHSIVLKFEN